MLQRGRSGTEVRVRFTRRGRTQGLIRVHLTLWRKKPEPWEFWGRVWEHALVEDHFLVVSELNRNKTSPVTMWCYKNIYVFDLCPDHHHNFPKVFGFSWSVRLYFVASEIIGSQQKGQDIINSVELLAPTTSQSLGKGQELACELIVGGQALDRHGFLMRPLYNFADSTAELLLAKTLKHSVGGLLRKGAEGLCGPHPSFLVPQILSIWLFRSHILYNEVFSRLFK